MQRLVLDTNIWLDWLLFDDPGLKALRERHAAGQLEIFIDAACEAELADVLGRQFGKHTLSAEDQAARLATCRRIAQRIDAVALDRASLPRCRDQDDQKFLEAALAAGAHALITKDRALLELARKPVPFKILRPDQF